MTWKKVFLFLAGVVVLGGFLLLKKRGAAPGVLLDTADTSFHRGDSLFMESGSLGRRSLRLSDSTRVVLNPGSAIGLGPGFPGELRLDGDVFFETAGPLVVRTRELVLHCAAGSALRVSAFSRDPGESAEVLRGQVRAEKSYASPDHDPETLGAGDMVMINRDIDLMEKETFDTAGLCGWVSGSLAFNNMPFDSAVLRLEDWFGVTIEVKGRAENYRVTGVFHHDIRLDQVLKFFSEILPMHYTIRRSTIEIVF